jgi:hypothetical protein
MRIHHCIFHIFAIGTLAVTMFGQTEPQRDDPPANEPPANAEQEKPAPSPAEQKLAEMNARMIEAFERIAAEYGNPSVVRVFTNDPQKGDELRRRLEMLQRVERLRSEATELEGKLADMRASVALRKREIAALDERMNQNRVALAAFVRLADEAERAFAAIGREVDFGAPEGGSKTPANPTHGALAAAPVKVTSFDPLSDASHEAQQ